MLDFTHLEQYTENNRLEVKRAEKGLPQSIWKTYSSFANTLGGTILLGVSENEDKTLVAVGLSNPSKLIDEFWNIINNPNKVNINILSDKDVHIQEVNGKQIIVIEVPRASRSYRPVYIGGNPITGTYRRNGEGDYCCTLEEYQAMLRDASVVTQDMVVIEESSLDIFNLESVRGYRQIMSSKRPGHVWERLADEDFLLRLGAVAIGKDRKKHPTAAGLLMFAEEYNIVREFPNYFLDYQEHYDNSMRWTDRIISSSGDWSGNLFDFYFRTYNKLVMDIKVPFKIEKGLRVDDTPVHKAIREVLVNCIVNADYYGTGGIVVIKSHEQISFSNPGRFRIEIAAAKVGGFSDPRNANILKMFNLIDIGERAGSGIPNVIDVWKKEGWKEPVILESLSPDRIKILLSLEKTAIKNGDKMEKTAIKNGDKNEKTAIKNGGKNEKTAINTTKKQLILRYLKHNTIGTTADIALSIGLKSSRTRVYLSELVKEGSIVYVGTNRNREYMLNTSKK